MAIVSVESEAIVHVSPRALEFTCYGFFARQQTYYTRSKPKWRVFIQPLPAPSKSSESSFPLWPRLLLLLSPLNANCDSRNRVFLGVCSLAVYETSSGFCVHTSADQNQRFLADTRRGATFGVDCCVFVVQRRRWRYENINISFFCYHSPTRHPRAVSISIRLLNAALFCCLALPPFRLLSCVSWTISRHVCVFMSTWDTCKDETTRWPCDMKVLCIYLRAKNQR